MTNLNFTTFPILTTERLTLRQLSVEDKEAVFALRSDPEINRYLDRQPCKSLEDAISFIAKVNENIEKKATLYWAITLTDKKTLVGTICLFDYSSEKSSAEFGYELKTQFQGQGIMKEAVKATIDYIFQSLGLKNIIAVAHCDNLNSIKLLRQFDFVKSIEPDNHNPDLHVFNLTR